MPKTKSKALIPSERIERSILLIRGHKVLLDTELADLYGVETRTLVQAVKRNAGRFPSDFMFQLDADEVELLRSQNVISKPKGRGGRRTAPYAFTEQGVAMLSSVLRSRRAIEVNVEIMRAFVRLRSMLASQEEFGRKLAQLERKYEHHDKQIKTVFEAIRQLIQKPPKEAAKIGFKHS